MISWTIGERDPHQNGAVREAIERARHDRLRDRRAELIRQRAALRMGIASRPAQLGTAECEGCAGECALHSPEESLSCAESCRRCAARRWKALLRTRPL